MDTNEKRQRGRPKAVKPLDREFKLRLTAEQAAKLTDYARRHGIRPSTAIRQAVLDMVDNEPKEE